MQHDAGYKLFFSHPEMVADLLRGYVDEDWVAALDFSSLERLPGSYVTEDLRERVDDVVWRVRLGSDWVYVYLLLEFQSTIDPWMALRMLVYSGLLYQDLIRRGMLTERKALPPLVTMVLYNGSPRWSAPTELRELMQPVPGSLARYAPSIRYLLIDEGRYAGHPLPEARNLVSALVGLENSRNPDDLRRVLGALIGWLNAPSQDSLRRAFTVWLHRVLLPARLPGVELGAVSDLLEMDTMLAERVKEWTREWENKGLQKGLEEGRQKGLQEGRQKGLQEGRQEGRQEGEALLLRRLLTRRFGELPAWVNERLANASNEELEHWADQMLEAATLEGVFGG